MLEIPHIAPKRPLLKRSGSPVVDLEKRDRAVHLRDDGRLVDDDDGVVVVVVVVLGGGWNSLDS